MELVRNLLNTNAVYISTYLTKMSVNHFSLIIFIYHYVYTANQNPFVLGPLCGNVNVMEVF